jgi:hypothetical protein
VVWLAARFIALRSGSGRALTQPAQRPADGRAAPGGRVRNRAGAAWSLERRAEVAGGVVVVDGATVVGGRVVLALDGVPAWPATAAGRLVAAPAGRAAPVSTRLATSAAPAPVAVPMPSSAASTA